MTEETRDLTIGQALDLGCEMAMAGNHPSAIGLYMGVLKHEPENFEAIERLGSSLFEMKRYHEALYWFWRGRKLNRRHPLALTNYGLTVCQLGHPEEGVVDLEKAIYHAERQPQMTPAAKSLCYNNLGNTLERLGRHQDALPILDKGIALNPADPFPHYNRGIVLLRLNRHREAIEALNRSLALRGPVTDSTSRLNAADALYNRGMGRLLLGDFKGGFEDYEARLLTSENNVINLGLPADKQWQGEDLNAKTILVHCEQGLGDDIQFMRFLPLLGSTYPTVKILLITHNAIKPMLGESFGVTVMEPGAKLEGEYDCWVPLMSLPYRLGVEDDSKLPAPWVPTIEPERIEKWRWSVKSPTQLNVGVCWAGNWLHKNDAHRSIALKTFGALFDVPGVSFASLQQIRPNETDLFAELKLKHANLRAFYFDDFRDTAAAMLNLDMVISVDTAVAHLSATLGVPTIILVPAYSTDWRWQLNRSDSPWYPSATVVRQPKVGDWASVITALRAELTSMATQTRAA